MEWMKSLIKTSKQDSLSSVDDCEMLSATLWRNSKLHQLQVRTEVINIEAIVAFQQNVLWTIQAFAVCATKAAIPQSLIQLVGNS